MINENETLKLKILFEQSSASALRSARYVGAYHPVNKDLHGRGAQAQEQSEKRV